MRCKTCGDTNNRNKDKCWRLFQQCGKCIKAILKEYDGVHYSKIRAR